MTATRKPPPIPIFWCARKSIKARFAIKTWFMGGTLVDAGLFIHYQFQMCTSQTEKPVIVNWFPFGLRFFCGFHSFACFINCRISRRVIYTPSPPPASIILQMHGTTFSAAFETLRPWVPDWKRDEKNFFLATFLGLPFWTLCFLARLKI